MEKECTPETREPQQLEARAQPPTISERPVEDSVDKLTHLIKLSVGTESVESLAAWQATRAAQTGDGLPCHVTRMFPRREAEVLAGGSIPGSRCAARDR